MADINRTQQGEMDLVVVGSSAGGIEALSVLVSTLPADFPAPIVLAQHLDPDHPSSLSSILQRQTALKVEIVDPSSLLEPGTIYVVPSNRHVIITDGHVALQEDAGKRPRPSIDLLLTTAAAVYGERLIAVILTGSGSDGAAGGVAVKAAGGTVVIQNPQTARYPSMPLALPPTVVDFESDIEQIGPLLSDLLKRIKTPEIEGKTADTLQKILELIKQQTTFNFRRYKMPTIVRRLARRMIAVQVSTLPEYAQYLETHAAEVGILVSAFLINVTHFFRDPEAFAYLKSEVLPQLIVQARSEDHVLRFWSAGCSTGEEAYSLAMLLADLLGAELPQWTIKIFATDVDETAVQFARRSVYPDTLMKDLPAAYREQFFEPVPEGHRISKVLRQMVTFGQHDLSQQGPFPNIDLVLCRNVLIYFSPRLQDDVLGHFSFSLGTGGYLFLGKSETIRANLSQYTLLDKTYKIYHCNKSVLPARRLTQPTLKGLNASKPIRKRLEANGTGPLAGEVGTEAMSSEYLQQFNEVMRSLPMAITVIDRAYRILVTNVAARRLLGILESGPEQDFLNAVRGIPYDQVRTALDTTFRERTTLVLSGLELNPKMGGNGRFVSLTIALMPTAVELAEVAIINISDVTEQIQMKQQLDLIQMEQMRLTTELSTANGALNRRNEELLDANDKLHVSNEDLILTHEELQASLEEFETTNEELQASNEELETAHEESQASNEELQTMHQESNARNLELMELMETLVKEQVFLKEIVELAPFYIMVLRGLDLSVQVFNPRYVQLLHGEQVRGQPLAQVADLFWVMGTQVVKLAYQAYQQDAVLTASRMLTRLTDTEGKATERYLDCTIVPSHDSSGKVYGLVIYTNDVTEQRTQELAEELDRLRLIFDRAEQVAFGLFDAQTTKLVIASSRYLQELAHTGELNDREVIGDTWHQSALFVPPEQSAELWTTVVETREPLQLPEVHYKFIEDQQESAWSGMLIPIIYAEQPETVRFVLTYAVDITEQVRARQELEAVDQLKDQWLSIAAHEINTPITVIRGNAELLQRNIRKHEAAAANGGEPKPLDMQRTRRILDTVVHQSDQVSRLVNDLMDVSRMKTGHFKLNITEQLDLVPLLRRVVEQQQNMTSEHAITLELTEESVVGAFDEIYLEQVLNNLINNAIKYSPVGTPITVGLVYQHPKDGANEVTVWVRDEGYGISEEQQALVFDRFYRAVTAETAAVKGIGIGLNISREIVNKHGGQMWLESKKGIGSTFYFSLPLELPNSESNEK